MHWYFDNGIVQLYQADARHIPMPDQSVHCVVTSPPYWALRDYTLGPDAIGLELTPALYVERLVEIFREVRRVLRDDGTIWVNLGDSYANDRKWGGKSGSKNSTSDAGGYPRHKMAAGLKEKDLVGIPWMVAVALREDGWYLRSDIIWSKPNPMPESVKDRPTRAHEYLFLLTKSARYYYDADAIQTPAKDPADDIRRTSQRADTKNLPATERNLIGRTHKTPDGWNTGPGANGTIHPNEREKGQKVDKQRGRRRRHEGFYDRWDDMTRAEQQAMGANKRTVWEIATQPYPGAHFATFPEALVEPCILAGTSEAGCCSACGSSWVREVEKTFVPQADVSLERGIKDPAGVDPSSGWGGVARGSNSSKTIGWHPSCDCQEEVMEGQSHVLVRRPYPPIPATVLDPFAGTATVCAVAQRLGRRAVGLDLKEEYLDLAIQRFFK